MITRSWLKDRLKIGWDAETRFLLDRSFDSEIAIDVGAHVGWFSRRLLNRGFEVHAFEPELSNFQKLNEHLGGQAFLNYTAVGEKRGVAWLNTNPRYWGRHSLNYKSFHVGKQVVLVEALWEYFQTYNIKDVAILKIDTEGTDIDVLRGMAWDVRPEVIMCEFLDCESRWVLVDHLRDKDYTCFVSGWEDSEPSEPGKPSHAEHLWIKPAQLITEAPAWGNVIALRNG